MRIKSIKLERGTGKKLFPDVCGGVGDLGSSDVMLLFAFRRSKVCSSQLIFERPNRQAPHRFRKGTFIANHCWTTDAGILRWFKANCTKRLFNSTHFFEHCRGEDWKQ